MLFFRVYFSLSRLVVFSVVAFLGLYGVFISSALLLLVVCFIDALIINNTKEI